ncbi:cell wall / vacuolar inhibitor of fructosidase 1, CELL WALL / VACUOLAR INHIBITOR OF FRUCTOSIDASE 1 [Hibiscus trionum]|uniref:Cell wall / vacuolar inhibitor of fructosidase 1, CELL WALL / VACUOLAR INHIBITOR OF FRUCTOSIDASE 1 n=1 Tax=Hibiscus trionum TaxID=183268 RepID=A0A9W7HMP0_HIBTR|nr:cell wall / vacuolar inhibitor of fructosidase 1, CELL WALL / VACUOLAR INHIBITOR OF FRUCTOSIDASE 1 [Hibiscus trionum]
MTKIISLITPFYDLCVSMLGSDPRGSSATVSELGLIAARSVFATASGTLYQIATLLRSATDPNLKKALSGCVDSYNTITKTDIPAAIEALETNNPKKAVSSAADAANEAQRCEDGFGGKSPVSDNNKMVHDRAVILQSIASLLH